MNYPDFDFDLVDFGFDLADFDFASADFDFLRIGGSLSKPSKHFYPPLAIGYFVVNGSKIFTICFLVVVSSAPFIKLLGKVFSKSH